MKLIIAIINNDDCPSVLSELNHKGYGATKLSTSGGFLRAGNSTLLIGTEDDKVDDVIAVISDFSRKRTQMVTPSPSFMAEGFISRAVEVSVGGATVFVVDVEKFIKL
ncbi:MAG: cyclic-di-AMP receptor [Clostridia bacterium]|nr:cyclic-di-AMP receptor [Clostridia bacterium]MBQ7121719.1 cyclic-di-AMP receptor [Clostridia bacterium]